ncbi:MAG: SPOR domain-containing protein [Flavobacteriia bacterium]|nr:SPOR domain-containing protein [Flavobacteriia bacterium]OJX36148.1 MAG: hypothetical protein BGO87_06695 [Flavobacteriia bacterium 40-80]
MEELIKNYLVSNKTLIIPQLGTLTLTNETTLDIMFLSYLKFDDKKLTEAYSVTKSCSAEEASVIIHRWVEELITDLDNGEKRPISDLGYFYKNSDGDYDFKSEKYPTAAAEIIAEEEPVIENVPIKEEAQPEEKPEPENLTTEILEETIPVEETIPPSAVVPDIFAKEEIDDFSPIEPEQEKSSDQEKEPDVKEVFKEEAPYDSHKHNDNQYATENEEEAVRPAKASVLKISLVIAAIIVLLSGVTMVIFYDNIKHYLPFTEDHHFTRAPEKTNSEAIDEEQKINPQENNQEDEITEEAPTEAVEEAKVEEVPVKIPEKTIPPANNNGEFFVIVGSFGNIENANRLVSDLQSKGYAAEIAANKNGLNLVSIARFSTLQEAREKTKQLENSWIFRK